ncbi:MAG: hypothetical protein WC958_01920 [Dehalococcoidales bacterium]
METKSLKAMVKDIFGSEAGKKEFAANPESVMSRYNLTGHEKTAVLNTASRVGLTTSTSSALAFDIEAAILWV